MDPTENICQHLNEIIDERQGDVICTDCGLILSAVYMSNFKSTSSIEKSNEYVLEILSRLNLPKFFAVCITAKIDKMGKEKKKESMLAFLIYKTLNELGCGVTLKEINSVTGFTDNQIYNKQKSNETIILNPSESLEKYCSLLGLPKNSYAVIKGKMFKRKTGHNPTTIIGSEIHQYCKENKIGINIEKISEILKVSPISIRRYSKLKKDES